MIVANDRLIFLWSPSIYEFFKPGKTLLADSVFHPAGVPLRGSKADACAKEHFGKKAMAFIDADSDGTTSIRQAETVAFIDRYVAVLSELLHGDTYACPGNAHAPGQLRAVRLALFLFQQEQRLQIILRRPARRGLPAHRMLPR